VIADASLKGKDHFRAIAAAIRARLLSEAKTTPVSVGATRVTVPALRRQLSSRSEALHKLFQTLDRNNNGVLDQDEFAFCVNKLYGQNLPDDAVRCLLTMADLNGDRVISYDEFVKFLEVENFEEKARSLEEKAALGLRLFYFNGRGRAELARLVLAEAGIPYEDVRFEKADWESKFKALAPQGQAPYLEVAGGQRLGQSAAIVRYVAKVGGLYGTSSLEAAKIDAVYETLVDALKPLLPTFRIADAAEKKAKQDAVFKDYLPAWVAKLEKTLGDNDDGKGFFVGKQVSYADLALFSSVQAFRALNASAFSNAPRLNALVERIQARPNIAAWLKRRPVTQF